MRLKSWGISQLQVTRWAEPILTAAIFQFPATPLTIMMVMPLACRVVFRSCDDSLMEFANLNVNVNPPFFRPLHHGQEKIDESRYPISIESA